MKKIYAACLTFFARSLVCFVSFLFPAIAFCQPRIQSFAPVSGRVGSIVSISGANFSTTPANNLVYFGDVRANVLTATTGALTVTVPESATYEPISVTVNNLTAYSTASFIVTYAKLNPSINSGTLVPKVDYKSGNSVFSLSTFDLDGDGKPDFVTGNYGDGTVGVFQNNCTPGVINFNLTFYLQADTRVAGLAIADIDGDGRPDILITDDLPHKLSVFRNLSTPGTISFGNRVDFSTGTYPVNLATGDVDGDGKPDVAVTNNQQQSVSVFRNMSAPGVISFASRVDFPTGVSPYGIAISDINGDAKTDLIVGNMFTNSVSLLLNNGNNSVSFADKQDYTTGDYPYGIAIGDADNDGKPDILTANLHSNDISVLKNTSSNGLLSFAGHSDIPVAISPNQIAMGDINGDGKVDLAVSSSNVYLKVLENTSTASSISFDVPDSFYLSGSSSAPAIADVDGDSKPDVLIGYFSTVGVLRNRSFPFITSFAPTKGITGTPVTIHGYDFRAVNKVTFGNTDALSDSIVNDSTIIARVGYGSTGNVLVYSPDLYGTLAGFTYIAPPVITSVMPATSALGTTVTIKGRNFNPVTDSNTVYFGAVAATAVAATDTTLQMIVPSGITYYAVSVTSHTLTGYAPIPFGITFPGGGRALKISDFQVKASLPTGPFPDEIAVADLDNDGKPDIINTNFTGNSISVLKNKSGDDSISFANRKDYATPFTPWGLAAGDFNGDGKPDIAVVNDDTYTGTVSIYRNRSTADSISLLAAGNIETGYESNPRKAAVSDFDGDGRPDIAVLTYTFVSILRNTTLNDSISFTAFRQLNAGSYGSGIFISDFNGDGKPDIATTDYTAGSVYVFRNTSVPGTISFAPRQILAAGFAPIGIGAGDLDGDGKPDIAVANYGNDNVSVYRNTSSPDSISFETRVSFSFPFVSSGVSPYYLSIADMDGDGKADLTVGIRNTSQLDIMRNVCTPGHIAFDDPFAYQTTSGCTIAVAVPADVNGDGRPDILTSNNENGTIAVLTNRIQEALPVKLLAFNGAVSGSQVPLHWKVTGTPEPGTFTIERSTDGNHFSAIGTVAGTANTSDYTFTDKQPYSGTNYYRLKITDADGSVAYSKVILESVEATIVKLYPNPAIDYIIVSGLTDTKLTTIRIYTATGSLVYQTTLQQSTKQISIKALSPGAYYLTAGSDKNTSVIKFIKAEK